jgi:hypothetical protein
MRSGTGSLVRDSVEEESVAGRREGGMEAGWEREVTGGNGCTDDLYIVRRQTIFGRVAHRIICSTTESIWRVDIWNWRGLVEHPSPNL